MMPPVTAYTARLKALLGSDDPLAVLAATPARLEGLAERIGEDGLERAWAPGKWTARTILCHLADVEIGYGFRLRQALAEPRHAVQAFDQDAWARRYAHLSAAAALDAFRAVRAWNLVLLRPLGTEDLERIAVHPERGEESVRSMIEFLAGHDLNHLEQLERVAAS